MIREASEICRLNPFAVFEVETHTWSNGLFVMPRPLTISVFPSSSVHHAAFCQQLWLDLRWNASGLIVTGCESQCHCPRQIVIRCSRVIESVRKRERAPTTAASYLRARDLCSVFAWCQCPGVCWSVLIGALFPSSCINSSKSLKQLGQLLSSGRFWALAFLVLCHNVTIVFPFRGQRL